MPQPDWLIDRQKLAGRFPPRVRARELWRIPEPYLAEAQDDATVLAIRAQEEAGLDIVTDGEIRRESYSNRFATALEGVDLDNPGTALDRSGHPNPVPRVVGTIRRKHAVRVDDLGSCAAHTQRQVKVTVPGPFTMAQQAQIDYYGGSREAAAMDYAAAVNEEIRDLFAAGADVVQIDEPYMQARPDEARAFGLEGAQPRAGRRRRHDRRAHLLRLRRHHSRAALGLFVPARAGRVQLRADVDRDRAVESRLRACSRRCRARRSCSACIDLADTNVETPEVVADAHPPRVAVRRCRRHHRRAGLRHEVPAARSRVRQAAGHGRRRRDRASRARARPRRSFTCTFPRSDRSWRAIGCCRIARRSALAQPRRRRTPGATCSERPRGGRRHRAQARRDVARTCR